MAERNFFQLHTRVLLSSLISVVTVEKGSEKIVVFSIDIIFIRRLKTTFSYG